MELGLSDIVIVSCMFLVLSFLHGNPHWTKNYNIWLSGVSSHYWNSRLSNINYDRQEVIKAYSKRFHRVERVGENLKTLYLLLNKCTTSKLIECWIVSDRKLLKIENPVPLARGETSNEPCWNSFCDSLLKYAEVGSYQLQFIGFCSARLRIWFICIQNWFKDTY